MLKKRVANLLIIVLTLFATVVVTTASIWGWHQPKVPNTLLKK